MMMLHVYTKNNCGWCKQAKFLLEKTGQEFIEFNIDEDAEAKEFVLAQGHRTMPQIYNDDGTLHVEGGCQGLFKKIEEKEEIDPTKLGSL